MGSAVSIKLNKHFPIRLALPVNALTEAKHTQLLIGDKTALTGNYNNS
jgi:hypothetical protein